MTDAPGRQGLDLDVPWGGALSASLVSHVLIFAKIFNNMSIALSYASIEESKANAIAFFKGVSDVPVYNSDVNYPFH